MLYCVNLDNVEVKYSVVDVTLTTLPGPGQKCIGSRYNHTQACPGIMPWATKVTEINV